MKLIFLTLFIFSHPAYSQAPSPPLGVCPVDVSESLRLITTSQGPKLENLDYPTQVWSAHLDLAQKLWTAFEINGNMSDDIGTCLRSPINIRGLNQALSLTFFERTTAQIKIINPIKFEILSRKNPIENIAFSAFAKCQACRTELSDLGLDRAAHYNHAAKSVLANVAKVSFPDWIIIFIHEIGHYYLPENSWIEIYYNEKNVSRLQSIVSEKLDQSHLTKEQLEFVDQWLFAGISLKFLAEWRVWSFTLDYIKAETNYPFGAQTEWLKQFHNLPENRKFVELYKHLAQNFRNPENGFASSPILIQRIDFLREKILAQVEEGKIRPLDFSN